jgi:hypothetical protein
MNKARKILIGVLALVVLLAVVYFYFDYRQRTISPPGSETLTSGGMTVNVTYNRPSVRGRVIFGSEAQNALQPYGRYWRLGANESTEITVNRDFTFNGSPLKAGTYRMYAIPGAENFEIRLNSELDKWGAFEPDYDLDVLKTSVPVQKLSTPVEQMTFSLAPAGDGINMICEWSDVRLEVPIKAQ